MKEVLSISLFGVLISLVAFEIGLVVNRKTKIALFNPLLIAILIVIIVLKFSNISLDSYNQGGKIISFLLAPATVALAVPLYKNYLLLKKNAFPIIMGIISGSTISIVSIIVLSRLFNINSDLGLSLVPKSVTTPIGIEVSKQIGGIPEVTVAAIVITGITGSILAPYIFKLIKVKDKVAIGVAIGTTSHALGTSKAIEMGEVEGAMSGLSIGIAGLVTVFLAPIIIKLMQYIQPN